MLDRVRFRYAAGLSAFIIALSSLAACGGPGSGGPGADNRDALQLKTPLATPTPSEVVTYTLISGASDAVPTIGGLNAYFTESFGSAPAGAAITIKAYDRPPGTAPNVVGFAIPEYWINTTYSAPVTFTGFPNNLQWTLPLGFSMAGAGFSIEGFDGTTGSLIDYHNQANLPGQTASLSDLTTVTVDPTHSYWWELLCGGTNPTNLPLNPAGQKTKIPPICGFVNTVVTIPSNDALSGAYLNYAALAPADWADFYPAPTPPPGTSSGLISIEIGNVNSVVPNAVSYGSGLLAFTADVPQVVPLAGKTLYVAGCRINLVWTPGGPSPTGCIDTNYTSGPLVVSGQSISFSGIPFPVTLPAMTGTDCSGLTDCVQPQYMLSVFY